MPNDGIDTGFPWPVAPAGQSAAAIAPADDGKAHVWAQKGFQFHDLLDIVNPFQHLPVVSSIYRWITGDGIGNLPRVVGDAIYGGPVGFVTGLLGVLVKEESGEDIGQHVIATLTGGSGGSATASTQAAAPAAEPAAPISTAADTVPAADAAAAAVAATSLPEASSASPAIAAAPSPPPPAAPAPPVLPDHPPIPLAGRGATTGAISAPPAPAAGSAPKDATDTFRAEYEQRMRPLQQRPATENGRVLTSQPIPLQIPPGALNTMLPPPRVIKVMAPTTTPATTTPAAQATPSATTTTSAPPSGEPIEVSRKMMDALDKYMALQKSSGAAAPRGAQVDVSQ